MAKYKIYAGIGGASYELRGDEYESYGGNYGILSWEECREDLIEAYNEVGPEDEFDD